MTQGHLPDTSPTPEATGARVRRSPWGSVVGAALCLLAYGGMVRLDAAEGTLRDGFTSQTIGLYLLAFAGFLVAAWWNEVHGIDRRWLWGLAIVFRILLLFTTPTLSDDVHRYLWDGHVASEGVNPYQYAIDAPELDQYEIPSRGLANNPSLGTPYLPTAQAVFASSALLAPSDPLTMQIAMVVFDLLTAVLLVRLLGVIGLPDRRVLLYLWNPLVVVEVAHGAHLDALMVMLSVAAVLLTFRPGPTRAWAAPAVLALATLTRPLPVLLLPVLWWRWTWHQRILYGAACVGLVVPFAVGAGLGLGGERTGTGVFGSTRVYGEDWEFNGAIHRWGEGLLTRLGLTDPEAAGRFLVMAAMATIAVVVLRRARPATGARESVRLMAVPLMGFVLLTPTMHPWYMLFLVAWLPFLTPADDEPARRWLDVAPWLYLSGAIVLSYLTYRDPSAFAELDSVRWLEWVPTVLLLAASLLARAHKSTSGPSSVGGAVPDAAP